MLMYLSLLSNILYDVYHRFSIEVYKLLMLHCSNDFFYNFTYMDQIVHSTALPLHLCDCRNRGQRSVTDTAAIISSSWSYTSFLPLTQLPPSIFHKIVSYLYLYFLSLSLSLPLSFLHSYLVYFAMKSSILLAYKLGATADIFFASWKSPLNQVSNNFRKEYLIKTEI